LKVEYSTSGTDLDVRFIEEHSASKWLGLVIALILLPVFIVIAVVSNFGVATYLGIAFLLAILFGRVYVLFGVSRLHITEDRLVLTRSLFFLRTNRVYQRNDVEKLGFVKEFNGYRNHQDSGLSLMVRQNLTPVLFARTILPNEATTFFGELSKRCPWLAKLALPVGALPY
jgi:hypothetical protein